MTDLPHTADEIVTPSGVASYEMRAWMEQVEQSVQAQTAIVSTVNSSNANVGIGSSFNGEHEQNDLPDVMVSCLVTGNATLYFNFSNDGGATETTYPVNGFSVSSGIHEFHIAVKGPRSFRIELEDTGGAGLTNVFLYTYYGTFGKTSSPLNQSVGLDSDAAVTRPSIAQDEITRGLRGGVEQWNKFGFRDDSASAAGEETIWAFPTGTNLSIMTTADTFDITYNPAGDGGGTSGATSLIIYYLDANERQATGIHVLGSTGTDTTSFTGLGINRVAIYASGSANINNDDIEFAATTSGDEQAIIPAGSGITQQCVFFCPNNATSAVKMLFLSANKVSGSIPVVTFKGYVYNRTVESTFEIFRYTMDTDVENSIYLTDPCNFRLSPRDTLYFTMDTNQNNTVSECRFSLNQYDNV